MANYILTHQRVTDLRPVDTMDSPYFYSFKVQCTSCRETHPNWVSISRFVSAPARSSQVLCQNVHYITHFLHTLIEDYYVSINAGGGTGSYVISMAYKTFNLVFPNCSGRNQTSSQAAEEKQTLCGDARTARYQLSDPAPSIGRGGLSNMPSLRRESLVPPSKPLQLPTPTAPRQRHRM